MIEAGGLSSAEARVASRRPCLWPMSARSGRGSERADARRALAASRRPCARKRRRLRKPAARTGRGTGRALSRSAGPAPPSCLIIAGSHNRLWISTRSGSRPAPPLRGGRRHEPSPSPCRKPRFRCGALGTECCPLRNGGGRCPLRNVPRGWA